MGKPLLCRLGFHKWRDYGNLVVTSWKEPASIGPQGDTWVPGGYRVLGADMLPAHKEEQDVHSEAVYEGQQCKRCGVRVMRRFVRNPDGTLSCIGWKLTTRKNIKE